MTRPNSARVSGRRHARKCTFITLSARSARPAGTVTDGRRAISHHQNFRAEKMEKNVRDIQTYNISQASGLLEKLEEDTRPDGDGSLLADHAALQQQHEQQQRARSLSASEPRMAAPWVGCRVDDT